METLSWTDGPARFQSWNLSDSDIVQCSKGSWAPEGSSSVLLRTNSVSLGPGSGVTEVHDQQKYIKLAVKKYHNVRSSVSFGGLRGSSMIPGVCLCAGDHSDW